MTSLIYRISLVLVCLFTFIILPLTSAKADTYTVTVFYDDYDINLGDGICADSTGACTLRAAVDESNFIIGADIIYLPNPGTYSVTQTVLSVTDRLTIQGTSKRNTVIEGDPSFGLFVVNGKLVTANFNNLTMTNANRAIYSSYGTVNVNDCLLYKNTGQNGAAIKTYYGNLIINNSSLIYNTAISTGGALYISHSVVSINNSDLSYNTSGGIGGAIVSYAGNDLTITNSNLSHNIASSSGGAIYYYTYQANTVTIHNTDISYNEAGMKGGGLYLGNAGSVYITNSLIANNVAQGTNSYHGAGGLGIAAVMGPMYMLIANTSITNNEAYNTGGGIRGYFAVNSNVIDIIDSDISKNVAKNIGGAISNHAQASQETATVLTLNITDTSIDQNEAEDNAALYLEATNANITRSSINENYSATNLSKQVEVVGGLLNISNSTLSSNKGYAAITVDKDLTITNGSLLTIANLHSVTIAENSTYGLINNLKGTRVTVANSLLANNHMNKDCLGDFTTLGYNLVSSKPLTCSGFSIGGANDILGPPYAPINALLTTLDYYGGNTRSHEWLSVSPVNTSSYNCLSEDQQGTSRSAPCDRGSREL